MNYTDFIVIAVIVLVAVISLRLFKKSGSFFRALFLSAASGIGGILAVNLLAPFTQVLIPVTPVTVFFSSFTGLSGVISLVLWQVIFSL